METDLAKLTDQMNNAVSQVQRRNKELESEVALLRAQLSAQIHQAQAPPAEGSRKRKRTSADDGSDDQVVSLQHYQDLKRRYDQLLQEYGDKVESLTQKWKKAKYTVQRWRQYIDDNYAKKEERERKSHEEDEREQEKREQQGRENEEAASYGPGAGLSMQARSNIGEPVLQSGPGLMSLDIDLTPRPSTASGTTDVPPRDHQRPALRRHPSSQATDVPSSPPPSPQKPRYSSDSEPTVVSARITTHGKRLQLGNAARTVKIKHERSTQNEPFDIPSGGNRSPSQQAGISKGISDLDVLPELDFDQDPRDSRYPTPASVRGPLLPVKARTEEQRPLSGQGDARNITSAEDNRPPEALKPISVNIPTPLIVSGLKEKRRSSRSPNSMNDKIVSLAEAGDDERSQLLNTDKSAKQPAISDEARGRLGLMMDQSQQAATPVLAKRIQVKRGNINDMATPLSRKMLHAASSRSFNASKLPTTPVSIAAKPPTAFHQTDLESYPNPAFKISPERPTRPTRPPLRSLPLQDLKLNDFKINPRFQGTDYAFADTIRGKEQRRCFRGCTRPDCCGPGLRKTFELAGGGTLTSKKSDREAMEAYLGPDWRVTLKGYDNEKRKKTLNEAHFTAWANDMGKHRTAFEKAPEPPGFWETEMPSTQQAMEYRELADQQEKEKIESRWQEAKAGNGRWIFRDDS